MEIINVVSIWDFGSKISINVDNKNRKKNYNAEVKRLEKGCFLLFASGKCVATGFKSLSETLNAFKLNFPQTPKFIKLSNITAHSKLKYRFKFEEILANYKNTSYEPELFPALYWREGKNCIISYDNGSIIITGATWPDKMIMRNFLNATKLYKKERMLG